MFTSLLELGDAHFIVDFHLLPIYDADLVLDVQWLASLGPTLFNYQEMWMQLDYQGKTLKLQELHQSQFNYITSSSITKQI